MTTASIPEENDAEYANLIEEIQHNSSMAAQVFFCKIPVIGAKFIYGLG